MHDQPYIGYLRVSTQEQATGGAGLDAQRTAILAEAERRGWRQVRFIEDPGVSGKDTRRPGLCLARDLLARGEARGLVVSKMDRLSRSLLDFATLMQEAQGQGWALIALDCDVDTSTASGELMANVIATFAHFERPRIGERIREALAEKRAQGVQLGRPRAVPDEVVGRIVRERGEGRTLRAIADDLTAEDVPTAHGGARWYASTVRSVLRGAGI
jgi:DNA invertase Pin-like site-specific DNA recombinase